MDKFTQDDVQIKSCKRCHDGFYKLDKLALQHKTFAGAQSDVFERELVVRGDAVGILLYDPTLELFAMVEQIRVGALERECSPWLLEIVAGLLDKPNEPKQQVAIREAMEEAGCTVQAIAPMIEYFCSPGGSTEFFSLFCGKVDLNQAKAGVFGLDEEHEDIYLHLLAVDDVLAMLNTGKINNAMTIIALQWFALNKNRLANLWQTL